MGYSKAQAEREWIRWKQEEEKQMRQLGVAEEIIQHLHYYDWKMFCSERKFLERQELNMDYIDMQADLTDPVALNTVQDMLADIDNIKIYKALQPLDDITLKILFYKIKGFSGREIGQKLRLDEAAVKQRIYRLRKKIKKYF